MKNQYIYQNKIIINAAKDVSEKLGIELSSVVEAYRLFFESIKDSIENTDFNNSDGGCNITMSYNVPSLFKLYTSKQIIENINNKKRANESSSNNEGDSTDDGADNNCG